jgi:hypothetical protein
MALAPAGAADDTDATADAANDTDTDTGDSGDQGSDSDVLVTIARGSDGGYVVYSGDEPEEGGDDESAEGEAGGGAPAGGMGGAGAGGGQQVDSIGAALKAALDILNEDASSAGAPGSSQDQFQAGYSAPQAATPASQPGGRRGLRYPPPAAT